MENHEISSSVSFLSKIFPPPDGVTYSILTDQSRPQNNNEVICLCDVAGKSFVGKGITEDVAQARSADIAIDGLGLAVVGSEVVNVANERRRLEFLVNDLRRDLFNARTSHDLEIKQLKEVNQNLCSKIEVINSDLVKVKDENEELKQENKHMRSRLGADIEESKEAVQDDEGHDTNTLLSEERPKIQFSLTKKSQAELRLEIENLQKKVEKSKKENDKIISENKKLQVKCKKMKDFQHKSHKTTQGLLKTQKKHMPEQDKVYKLLKKEIKKLKDKNERLSREKAAIKSKLFNFKINEIERGERKLNVKVVKDESDKLNFNYALANYAQLGKQNKVITPQNKENIFKTFNEEEKNKKEDKESGNLQRNLLESEAEIFLLKTENEFFKDEYEKKVGEMEQKWKFEKLKSELVKSQLEVLKKQLGDLEEGNAELAQNAGNLSFIIDKQLILMPTLSQRKRF